MVGKITLIGAGPGDPELLTVKALRKIRTADVVVYDRLINPDLLNECRLECEKIYVGKNPNYHPVPQEQIEEVLVQKARENKVVVRLKSGDPYVFGRGGEEGSRLKEQGIPFEVVPGITSAIGGLAYAGIPITHRDYASSFHVITGHLKSEEGKLDWQTLAQLEGTLVFLMGMSELKTIAENLTFFGKFAETPVAIIQWASRKAQKTVVGTLATIYEKAVTEKMGAPSLIVIGEVVRLRQDLNFFEEKPLFGQTIALPYTKTRKMYQQFVDLGAELIEFPPARVIYSEQKLPALTAETILFFSKESVAVFAEKMIEQGIDWRHLAEKEVMSVGHHTTLALQEAGIKPDQVFKTLEELSVEEKSHLIVGEKHQLMQIQKNYGTDKRLQFWETHEEKPVTISAETISRADYIYLPSSKAARLFLASLAPSEKQLLAEKKIIVMGAVTANELVKEGLSFIQTAEPSYESVSQTIVEEV